MAFSNSSILAVVELICYAVLIPFSLYVGFRHGKKAILGYLYLNILCTLRVVADIIQLASGTNPNAKPSLAATIVSSVGLSPLLLGLAGFLHEIHIYVVMATASSRTSFKKANRWMWFAQFQIHGTCVVGVILVIIGTVELYSASSTSQLHTDDSLRSAGAVILVVLWGLLLNYAIYLLRRCRQLEGQLVRGLSDYIYWTQIAAVFIGVKMVYVVVYTFDHNDASLSPVTGSFAIKVIFTFLTSFLAALSFTIGGWRSLHIAVAAPKFAVVDRYDAPHEVRTVQMNRK
ncbi:hypothetical protein BDY17DRAFT_324743 [Neohortaea acidophila]|uniref:DUF7702 domain-containing protein n=1 Tax=Neohortaea acidophila TaxID=245834 RepID=A0A6A6PSJ1_9PEZI|nr:uncharacterized protein BDY17DRAFT_324743 [Neohortaea acidophila]KAF2482463.1 hypothetical protein BDY17DRAFT_324743 [Neohortaea acidophila]